MIWLAIRWLLRFENQPNSRFWSRVALWRQVSFSFEFFKFFAAPFSNNNFATSYRWNDIATNKSVRLWNFPNLEVLLITYFLALEWNQINARWYNSERLLVFRWLAIKIVWFSGCYSKLYQRVFPLFVEPFPDGSSSNNFLISSISPFWIRVGIEFSFSSTFWNEIFFALIDFRFYFRESKSKIEKEFWEKSGK